MTPPRTRNAGTDERAPRLIGLGAGGHAKCVVDAILSSGRGRVTALLDADQALWGARILGVPVAGGPSMLAEFLSSGIRSAFIGVGGIPDPTTRRTVFDQLHAAGFRLPPIAHPAASVSRWSIAGAGCQVMAAAVVNADASLGQGSVVGAGAIIGHDSFVGDFSHVASGVRLGGGVHIGREVLIGAGAIVLQGLTVGDGAIVGAGAVVTDNVAATTTVIGVPATLQAA